VNAFSNGFFIHIGGSSINQPVAGFDSVDDAPLAFVDVCNLEDAVADGRHLKVVIQGDVFHGAILSMVCWDSL
jgi:hypothetical protein